MKKIITKLFILSVFFLFASQAFAVSLNFTANDISGDLGNSHAASFGDVDGDGDNDIYVGDAVSGVQNRLWINDGSGNFTASNITGDTSLQTVFSVIADVDNDGDNDIYVLTYNQNKLWINDGLGNGGASFTASDIVGDTGQSRGASVGDVDGDGDNDIYTVNNGTQNKLWINDGLGNGGASFTASDIVGDTGNSYGATIMADLDGDTDLDLYVPNYTNQQNKLWINDGLGNGGASFTANDIVGDTGQSRGASVGDVDGDGDNDIYVANFGQQNKLWINNGSGVFTVNDIAGDLGGSISSYIADIDHDGYMDIYVPNHPAEQNKLWINNGSGSFTASDIAGDLGQSIRALVADFNGDTFNDIYVANYNNEQNKLWLNTFTFQSSVYQKTTQADPTPVDSAIFTVNFTEAIDPTSFVAGDITLAGTTGTVTSGPTEVAPNDGTRFEFTVSGMASGDTVTATLAGGVVDNVGATQTNDASTLDSTTTHDIFADGSAIATYTFNGDLTDLSGNYDGIDNGGITFGAASYDDGAVFDGSNDYMVTSNPITLGNNFTVSTWYNADDLNDYHHLMTNNVNQGNGAFKRGHTNGTPYYFNTGYSTGATISLSSGSFHHIVYTYDGTDMNIYANNTLVNTKPGSINLLSANYRVGAGVADSRVEYSDGTQDQLRIFNRALTATEVAQLYTEQFDNQVTYTDTTAPGAPASAPDLQPASDSGSSNSDDKTNDNTPAFDIVCTEVGSTITLYTDNPAANTAAGTYTCISPVGTQSITATTLVDGTHNISYTETDVAGNESGQSPQLTVDVDTMIDPTTINAPTNGQPVTGTTEPNASVTITTPSGAMCTTVADGAGNYSCSLVPDGMDGEDITATGTDEYGNSSNSTETGGLDISAPTSPTINPVSSGATAITGTGEPGTIITLAPITCTNATVIVTAGGTWECLGASPIPIIGTTITAVSTDGSGNTSTGTYIIQDNKKKASKKRVPDVFKPKSPSTESNPLGGDHCPSNLLIHDFMKDGDTNGVYSSYNNGVVTEISLLQSHINRILEDDYGPLAAGPVDKWFRSKTKLGVERIQQKLNQIIPTMKPLVIDGIVGSYTREAINQSC